MKIIEYTERFVLYFRYRMTCHTTDCFLKISHYADTALEEDLVKSLAKCDGLKTSVKTRWSTAWDCCDSIVRLENNLKHVSYKMSF